MAAGKSPSRSVAKASLSPLGSPSSRSTRTLIIIFMVFAMLVFIAGLVMIVLAWRGRRSGGNGNNNGDADAKVIVVTAGAGVGNGSGDPPVYPLKSPDYPLRNAPRDYQQVGVLVDPSGGSGSAGNSGTGSGSVGGEPTILALFGRKMQTRDRWEYYVASDKFHMWKLPVQVQKRVCDHEFGCEEIYNGDQVVVPDYGNRVFTARIYAYSTPDGRSNL